MDDGIVICFFCVPFCIFQIPYNDKITFENHKSFIFKNVYYI